MGIIVDPNPSNQPMATRKGSNLKETPNAAGTGSGNKAVDDATKQGETVTLSAMASILSSSGEGLASGKVVDKQRVTEIKAALDAGKYEVNARNIAEKLALIEKDLSR